MRFPVLSKVYIKCMVGDCVVGDDGLKRRVKILRKLEKVNALC